MCKIWERRGGQGRSHKEACVYLLQVLKVLEKIGTSLIGIETHNTTMFKSSSKISTVGRLLDWTNKAEKEALCCLRWVSLGRFDTKHKRNANASWLTWPRLRRRPKPTRRRLRR